MGASAGLTAETSGQIGGCVTAAERMVEKMDSSTEGISALIKTALEETYRATGQADTTDRLNEFTRQRASDLSWLEARYAGDPLVGRLTKLPELAKILERLERDPTGLMMHWPRELPRDWLETLAELWGTPL